MRMLQTLIVKLVMLALLAGGAAILASQLGVALIVDTCDELIASLPAAPEQLRLIFLAIGGAAALAGLLGLWPFGSARVKRVVSFRSGHGTVSIALDSGYRVIHRLLNKMPEVRKASFTIDTVDGGRELLVCVHARLNQVPGQSARMTALRVSNYIRESVSGFLGMEDMISVDLNIQDFTMDTEQMKQALIDAPVRGLDAITSVAAMDAVDDMRMKPVEATPLEKLEEVVLPELPRWESAAPETVAAGGQEPPESVQSPRLVDEVPEAEELPEAHFEEGALPPLRDDADAAADVPEPPRENEKDAWSF